MNRLLLLRVAAAALTLAGLALSLRTVSLARDTAQRIGKKNGDLESLNVLRRQARQDQSAVAAFERLANQHPTPLNELLAQQFQGSRPELRPHESRPAVSGWTVRSSEIRFDEVSLAAVLRFLQEAESRRPPWRASEIAITASDKTPGYGRVTLVLEALDKTGPR